MPGPSGVQESNTALDLDVSNRGAGGSVLRVPEVRCAWPFLAAVETLGSHKGTLTG